MKTKKSLSEFTSDELQGELEKRKREMEKTEKFLESKNISESKIQYVTVPAESVIIAIESLKGDSSYAEHYTDSYITGDFDSLLSIAIAELEEPIRSLNCFDEDHNLESFYENTEVIGEITLADIGQIATEMSITGEFTEFNTLTKEQNDKILQSIIGESLESFRKELYVYAPAIKKVINEHIRKTIASELGIILDK